MRIKELRNSINLSQCDIAKLLGISQQAYSSKEIGKSRFSIEEVLKLEKILDTTMKGMFSQ